MIRFCETRLSLSRAIKLLISYSTIFSGLYILFRVRACEHTPTKVFLGNLLYSLGMIFLVTRTLTSRLKTGTLITVQQG